MPPFVMTPCMAYGSIGLCAPPGRKPHRLLTFGNALQAGGPFGATGADNFFTLQLPSLPYTNHESSFHHS